MKFLLCFVLKGLLFRSANQAYLEKLEVYKYNPLSFRCAAHLASSHNRPPRKIPLVKPRPLLDRIFIFSYAYQYSFISCVFRTMIKA